MLTGKTVLLHSVQEFIEFPPTFFISLHNQLISINSIVTYSRVKMFEKCDSSNREKWMFTSFNTLQDFYGKIRVGFFLT